MTALASLSRLVSLRTRSMTALSKAFTTAENQQNSINLVAAVVCIHIKLNPNGFQLQNYGLILIRNHRKKI